MWTTSEDFTLPFCLGIICVRPPFLAVYCCSSHCCLRLSEHMVGIIILLCVVSPLTLNTFWQLSTYLNNAVSSVVGKGRGKCPEPWKFNSAVCPAVYFRFTGHTVHNFVSIFKFFLSNVCFLTVVCNTSKIGAGVTIFFGLVVKCCVCHMISKMKLQWWQSAVIKCHYFQGAHTVLTESNFIMLLYLWLLIDYAVIVILISRNLNFTLLLNKTAVIVSLLLSGYISEESTICHLIHFSCLNSCVVSIWIVWTFYFILSSCISFGKTVFSLFVLWLNPSCGPSTVFWAYPTVFLIPLFVVW
jgi:hypothetical protein